MSEKFLHRTEIRPSLEQVSCVRVTKRVRESAEPGMHDTTHLTFPDPAAA